MTTITLHYYSDSDRGLPRLRFYAVPDDFDIWDAPTTSITNVDVAAVPPGGEPAGRKNFSINVNFNTKKLLMYKFSSTFQFAVSEVEFFNCKQLSITIVLGFQKQCLYAGTVNTSSISNMAENSTLSAQTDSESDNTTTFTTSTTTVKRRWVNSEGKFPATVAFTHCMNIAPNLFLPRQ